MAPAAQIQNLGRLDSHFADKGSSVHAATPEPWPAPAN